jgi:predicted house-cleaning noncanonical NTP pyrophosphatase (MazG superfamily)
MTQKLPNIVASWELRNNPTVYSKLDLGGKAFGLLNLPEEWVPCMLIFTRSFYELQGQHGINYAFNHLTNPELILLEDFLKKQEENMGQILVRSNIPHTHGDYHRDHFHSIKTTPILSEIINSFEQIIVPSSLPVFIILQPVIEPAQPGHMSNERRVSQKKTHWIIEGIYSKKHFDVVDQKVSQTSELLAATESEVIKQLQKVATKLINIKSGFFHCEWLWTGRKVWIVQADEFIPKTFINSANSYLISKSEQKFISDQSFDVIQPYYEVENNHWKKLRCPKIFSDLHLPSADIYLLTGEAWNESKIKKHSRLVIDLNQICTRSVIVRCDVTKGSKISDDYLPTSAQLLSPNEIIEFMEITENQFNQNGYEKEEWGFLLSQTYLPRASAMVHARPGSQCVQIDALWGFPDGLFCYSHDTYFYLLTKHKIYKNIHYKDYCYLINENQSDTFCVDPPFDWKRVLSDNEIITLAEWGLKIANHIGHEIQLMAFARIDGKRGPKNCLPWHFTDYNIPEKHKFDPQLVNSRIFTIRTKTDLENIKNHPSLPLLNAILFLPDSEFIRNRDFAIAIAKFAKNEKLPILFKGSLLGHAYYAMVNEGAKVVPIHDDNSPIDVIHYNKLVRDLIPAVISQAGGVSRVREIPRKEAIVLLKQKLIEEAFEVWEASAEELAEELADILEVIDSLSNLSSISEESIKTIQNKKRKKKGGFENLTFLQETASRPLVISQNNPGELPLFLDEELAASKTKGMRNGKKDDTITIVKTPSGDYEFHFSISLIPPVVRGTKVQQRFDIENYIVRIQYRESKILLEIGPKQAELSTQQLPLFTIEPNEEIEGNYND